MASLARDGDAGEIVIFVEGQRIINETRANARMTFRTFRMGNMQYMTTGGRSIWYDDVMLAPASAAIESLIGG